jgi:hypothetical protein
VKEITMVMVKQPKLLKTFCDLCGTEQIGGTWTNDGIVKANLEREVKIKYKELISDPDGGGESHTYELDICPTCFLTKVKPMLEQLGAKVEVKTVIF